MSARRPHHLFTGWMNWELEFLKEDDWVNDPVLPNGNAGFTNPQTGKISIRCNVPESFVREILTHEMLHAVWLQAGLTHTQIPTDEEDHEEQCVALLSGPMLVTLRDNPKVLAYLTEK